MKPGRYSFDTNGIKRWGVFTWDDHTCDDYEPRQTQSENLQEDSI